MVAGEEVKTVRIRLLVDAVLDGAAREVGYESDVTPGVAGRFTSVGRAVIVSTTEDEKLPAVGSVAGAVGETKQVEVENAPKNDLVHVPVENAVVVKPAAAKKAAVVATAATADATTADQKAAQ